MAVYSRGAATFGFVGEAGAKNFLMVPTNQWHHWYNEIQWMRTSKEFLNKESPLECEKYHAKLLNIVTQILNIVTIP